MRIALTITELDPGGAEQCLVQLAIFLANRGHAVKVMALGPTPAHRLGASTHRSLLLDQLDQANIAWKCGAARGSWSLVAATRWLRNELRQFKPEVIQSMLFHANVVTALANSGSHCPHFGGARVVQPTRWRRWFHRWACRRMIKLVCVSQRVAQHCALLERVESTKLVVIPNGVQLDQEPLGTMDPPALLAKYLPSSETPFLLFVGRLSEQKGILPLIQRADELLRALPSHHWVLLGDGPLRPQIESTIARLQHRQRIHVLGWQPHARQWMSAAQLLLLPSMYEGMPNVVLEAMAEKCPVVSFDVEGIEELLGATNNQVVSADLTAFIQRAHELINAPELRQTLVQNNLERVQGQFNLPDQLAKYETLYAQHLATKTKSQ